MLNNIRNIREKKDLSGCIFGLHKSLTRKHTKRDKFLKRTEIPFLAKSFNDETGPSGCASSSLIHTFV